jgi:hypothetical protein
MRSRSVCGRIVSSGVMLLTMIVLADLSPLRVIQTGCRRLRPTLSKQPQIQCIVSPSLRSSCRTVPPRHDCPVGQVSRPPKASRRNILDQAKTAMYKTNPNAMQLRAISPITAKVSPSGSAPCCFTRFPELAMAGGSEGRQAWLQIDGML